MQVLITGGAGFIGSHTAEALLASGASVRILDNLSTGKRENLPVDERLDLRMGDICNQEDVAQAMQGITHVLHLAAQVSVQASIEDPATSCSQNIQGFVNVLSAAKDHQVRRFVYASSAAVYGIPQSVPVSEKDDLRPISPYGLEKSVNEQYAHLFHDLFGFNSLGLRYFNVYGPRQDPTSPYAGVISKFLECIEKGHPLTVFGDGYQTRDFIFVKDVASANVAALTQEDASGYCNVGTGETSTLLDVIQVLSDCVQQTLEVNHLAARDGDIVHSSSNVDRIAALIDFSAQSNLVTGLEVLARHLNIIP